MCRPTTLTQVMSQTTDGELLKSPICCCTSSSYCVVCVCVPGFQGAGDSSHRHHIPHRFLLLCQLCEGWHSSDAAARLLRLPSGGKPAGFHDGKSSLRKGKEEMQKRVSQMHWKLNRVLWNAKKYCAMATGNLTWIQPLFIFLCESFPVYARCEVTLHLHELSCAQRSIMGNG